MAIILGVDPGSCVTGFGVIETTAKSCRYLASGCIRVKAKVEAERLSQIFTDLSQIITEFSPTTAAIEQVFMFFNASSALKLGQARGAALVAMAHYGLDVASYSAKQVKQAVVGYGGAEKSQVQHMVMALLGLNKKPASDAADALAIALCHYHTTESLKHFPGAKKTVSGRLR